MPYFLQVVLFFFPHATQGVVILRYHIFRSKPFLCSSSIKCFWGLPVCVCYLHKLARYVVVRSKQKGPSFEKKVCMFHVIFFCSTIINHFSYLLWGGGVSVFWIFIPGAKKMTYSGAHTQQWGGRAFSKEGVSCVKFANLAKHKGFWFCMIFFFAAASSLFLLWKFAQGLEKEGGRGRKYELSWFFCSTSEAASLFWEGGGCNQWWWEKIRHGSSQFSIKGFFDTELKLNWNWAELEIISMINILLVIIDRIDCWQC